MTSIHSILLMAHVLISIMIIGLVLFQRGKGAEAGAAFGAGASGTVFGAKGSANFLSRSTAVLATLFFMSSISLAYLGSQRPAPTSLMDSVTSEPAGIGVLPAEEPAEGMVDDLPVLPGAAGAGDAELPATDSADGGLDQK